MSRSKWTAFLWGIALGPVLLLLAIPSAGASPSRIGPVKDCNDYRSVYHPGKGGCYYLSLDRALEAALPQLCSLSAPRRLPPRRSWTDRRYVSPYTGKRGFTGIRIDETINANFDAFKRAWCSGKATTVAGGKDNASGNDRRTATGGTGTTTPVTTTSTTRSGKRDSTGDRTPTAPTPPAITVSGDPVPWLSGMHCEWKKTNPRALAAWRGHPLEIAQAFVFKWGYMANIEKLVARYRRGNPGARLMLSLPLLAERDIGDFRGCVSGKFDARYRAFARKLVESGAGDAHIRLAAEFNNRSDRYRAFADPRGFVACYRRVVRVLKSAAPNLKIEWGPNRTGKSYKAENLVRKFWPGDEYVDGVTLSFYDHSPAAKDINWWKKWYEDELNWWASFVRDKGIKLNFAEWGINKRGDGFDNPLYIRKMYEFFWRNRDVIGYEIYYNCSSVQGRLYPGNENPKAAAVYRRLWSGR